MLFVIITTSPRVSKPVLPARPLIYLYFAESMSDCAIKGDLKMTAFAGRLMPVLRVEVATRTYRVPCLYPFSIIVFSSFVKPE